MKVWRFKSLGKREPSPALATPITDPGLIHRHTQCLCTARLNTLDELPIEAAIALPVQKEPDWRGTSSHTFLDGGRPGGTVNEDCPGISRTPRRRYFPFRM